MTRPHDESSRRPLIVLVLAAAVFFTANIHELSLLPNDDCFYARKGVETWQRGAFYAVTWNGLPAVQNPPLQFWLLGRSFAAFGENDFAARLPSVLMALGLLLMVWRIGRLTIGPGAALTGVACLLLTPLFLHNARRCMLEIPTCFWTALFLLAVLEARARPRLALAAAVPLAGGLLTKSLLGLMPLGILISWLLHGDFRPMRRSVWLWSGIAAGLLCGASWPVHQGFHWGWWSLEVHYLEEIGSRAAGGFDLRGTLLDYPRILLLHFQPIVIPGLVGAVVAVRRCLRVRADRAVLLAAWALLPVLLCSFASSRSARYVFPVAVPLALLSGQLLHGWRPRLARVLYRIVVPALLVAGAATYWIAPRNLTRDLNAPFKQAGPQIAALLPPGTDIPSYGPYEWDLANSLLYYGQHAPAEPVASVSELLAQAKALPNPVFVTRRERLAEVETGVAAGAADAAAAKADTVTRAGDVELLFELRDWVIGKFANFD